MYDHSKCALHCGVGQSTTKHDIFVIIISPLEVRNRDKKTLHESNKKRSNTSNDHGASTGRFRDPHSLRWVPFFAIKGVGYIRKVSLNRVEFG